MGRFGVFLLWLGVWTSGFAADPHSIPPLDQDDGKPWILPQAGRRMVVVSDLHADPNALFAIADYLDLMDGQGRWTGGTTILVNNGDDLSRGPNSRLILDTFRDWTSQAAAAGGLVVKTLGNHELYRLQRQKTDPETEKLNYLDFAPPFEISDIVRRIQAQRNRRGGELHPGDLQKIRSQWLNALGSAGYRNAFSKRESPYAQDIAGLNAITKIGRTLILHAGFDTWLKDNPVALVPKFNSSLRRFMREHLSFQAGEREFEPNEPWVANLVWARRLAQGLVPAEVVEAVCVALDVDQILIGHSVTKNYKIRKLYDGRVWNIDTGRSVAWGGALSAMVIEPDGKPHPIDDIPRLQRNHPVYQILQKKYADARGPFAALLVDFEKVRRESLSPRCSFLLKDIGKKRRSNSKIE